MRGIAKFIFGLVYAAGILLMMVFGGSEYDWMRQMDPSINAGQIDGTKDRQIFTLLVLLVLLVVLATTFVSFFLSRTRAGKAISITLAGIALLVWYVACLK